MSNRITKYRFSAPHVFSGEMILEYRNGYLHGIEGIKFIGNKWDNMCINKAIPFRESDIPSIREDHANRIYFTTIKHNAFLENAPATLFE